MTQSANLNIPFMRASQSREVVFNEAIAVLDSLVQPRVLSTLSVPPGSVANGDSYIIGTSPTLEWTGLTGRIATWFDGAWYTTAPKEGWTVYSVALGRPLRFLSGSWQSDHVSWSDSVTVEVDLAGFSTVSTPLVFPAESQILAVTGRVLVDTGLPFDVGDGGDSGGVVPDTDRYANGVVSAVGSIFNGVLSTPLVPYAGSLTVTITSSGGGTFSQGRLRLRGYFRIFEVP